ncbi:MAG: cytochrome c maturation protein CcmE [Betaproteobacteria bacterium]|jgi:cytochrome c-type biogenesis protein CcmE
MTPRSRRTLFIVGAIATISIASFLILRAFNENLVFFFTPTQIVAKEAPVNKEFRIGGMVLDHSLKRELGGLQVEFVVTDMVESIPVKYNGILPDLFKEGKGVVAQGKLNAEGVFVASQVLAKHDENYMPPEAKSALDQAKKSPSSAAKTLLNKE